MKKKRLKSFADKENIWSDKERENGGKYAGLAKLFKYDRGRWTGGKGKIITIITMAEGDLAPLIVFLGNT